MAYTFGLDRAKCTAGSILPGSTKPLDCVELSEKSSPRLNQIAIMASAMAISPRWYRENADACARRAQQARDPTAKAAYKEMVRAWLILAAGAEQLIAYSPSKPQALAA